VTPPVPAQTVDPAGQDTVTITGTAQHLAWQQGLLPAVEQVRPGLWSIPVPIPDNPLRYTLSYALEHPDGLVVIDPGWHAEPSWDALCAGIARTGHPLTAVTAVLATHLHPDHYGLADRLRSETGAWIGLHPADAALLQPREISDAADDAADDDAAGLPGLVGATRGLFEAAGAPTLELPAALVAAAMRHFVPTGAPDRLLRDGQQLRFGSWRLRVLHTPGHTPGHICLHEPGQQLVFTGDHVLPRITGTVGLHSSQDLDALAEFLTSLAAVRALGAGSGEVLPAHEYRFTGLPARVDQIIAHHEKRLQETLAAVQQTVGGTAWDIAQQLAWSRSWDQIDLLMRRVAAAETLAHLVLLHRRGQIEPVRSQSAPPTTRPPGQTPSPARWQPSAGTH
jgi:glyoxylase-like metal-dependent hydrolase (beta-lactamase superfamily II)